MNVWGLVLAGGSGTRFGGPKQFQMLGHQRLVDWSVERARATCDAVALVVPEPEAWDGEPVDACVAGGGTHAASTRNGLAAIPDDADIVMIVTVSHPLASEDLFARVRDALIAGWADDVASVAPVVGLPDALKEVEGDAVTSSVDKTALVAVQAPSAFRARLLREATAQGSAPEEHELIEAICGRILTVPVEDTNLHITT
ncbi:MAG: NTP transferase domain-containing protein, partial [Acidimicrobiales bacterium]|nr:NTP transferase domain-containing protein [Acidimicrobiales bacterium]